MKLPPAPTWPGSLRRDIFILLHKALWDTLAQTDLSASLRGRTELHAGTESNFLHRPTVLRTLHDR